MDVNQSKIIQTPLISSDIETRQNKSKCLKIVCVVIPNHGHMIPMSHLAEGLKDRGHDVTLVSNGNETGKVIVPRHFDFKGIKWHLTEGGPEQSVIFDPK